MSFVGAVGYGAMAAEVCCGVDLVGRTPANAAGIS